VTALALALSTTRISQKPDGVDRHSRTRMTSGHAVWQRSTTHAVGSTRGKTSVTLAADHLFTLWLKKCLSQLLYTKTDPLRGTDDDVVNCS